MPLAFEITPMGNSDFVELPRNAAMAVDHSWEVVTESPKRGFIQCDARDELQKQMAEAHRLLSEAKTASPQHTVEAQAKVTNLVRQHLAHIRKHGC